MNSLPTPSEIKSAIDPTAYYRRELAIPSLKAGGDGWSKNVQCPFHDDSTPSFGVNLHDGSFRCFGCGAHGGSVIDFHMERHGVTLDESRKALTSQYGISRDAQRQEATPRESVPPTDTGNPVLADKITHAPIPDSAISSRPQKHPTLGAPIATWMYSSPEGAPLAFVCRFETTMGKKVVLPLTWGGTGWIWKNLPAPRPLYNLHLLASHPDALVVVCEGEKAADAAARMLPDCVTTTGMNGSSGADKADWSPLRGRRVLVWPDADTPGEKYALRVKKLTLEAGALSATILPLSEFAVALGVDSLPSGWDSANAEVAGIAEKVRGQIEQALRLEKNIKPSCKGGSIEEAALPTLPALASLTTNTRKTHPNTSSTTNEEVGFFTYTETHKNGRDGRTRLLIESEAARTLSSFLTGNFAFNSAAQTWHQFTGTHWQPCASSTEATEFIAAVMYRGCHPLGFRQTYLAGVVGILMKSNGVPLPVGSPGKIPFRNGLLDMSSKSLEPVTASNAHTWCIPHDHIDGKDCLLFQKWLLDCVDGDVATAELLLAFIAACITGRADLQKFLFLQGLGGTGKSAFIRLLVEILGKCNCVSTDLRQLEINRFEAARLYGKRLASITDSDKYGGAVNVLKAITGQDAVRLERKNQQQDADFTFDGMVIVAANEALATTDHTSGLARRPIVVRFDKRLSEADRLRFSRHGGEAALHAEIPKIINLALSIPRDEVSAILKNPPERAAASTFRAITDSNPVAAWIEEWLIPSQGAWTQIGDRIEIRSDDGEAVFRKADVWLYANYATWCRRNTREILSARRFRATTMDVLGTLGVHTIESRRSLGTGIQGIRLRNVSEPPHDWFGSIRRASAGYVARGFFDVGFSAQKPAPVLHVAKMLDFEANSSRAKNHEWCFF